MALKVSGLTENTQIITYTISQNVGNQNTYIIKLDADKSVFVQIARL